MALQQYSFIHNCYPLALLIAYCIDEAPKAAPAINSKLKWYVGESYQIHAIVNKFSLTTNCL